jgi:hypothetical protein
MSFPASKSSLKMVRKTRGRKTVQGVKPIDITD